MIYEDDFLNQHKKNIMYNNVKEVEEYIKFLKDKNSEVILKYYDNKHDGDQL